MPRTVTVDVELEATDREASGVVRQPGESIVEHVVGKVMGDGDVRVVGEVHSSTQEPGANLRLESFAPGNP